MRKLLGNCLRSARLSILLLSAMLLFAGLDAHGQGMPAPARSTAGSGSLSLEGGVAVSFEGYTEPRLERARDRFLAQLARQTGIAVVPAGSAPPAAFHILTERAGEGVQQPGEDESYRLVVTTHDVLLRAPNPLGVLHGLQTFLQLVAMTPRGFAVAAVTIEDAPRFPWRGLMIDTGRHFMPLAVLRENLDLMEAVKLNVFHWHLSEDQGFRIESLRYPLLQQKGSDGLFYTQQQVRELIAYARDRGIRVVPEFDMPGHATAWFVGYPELASGTGPYAIERKWGVFDPAVDPTRESTYSFLDGFLQEMTALFPDAYFHIGGDECNGKEWDRSPRIHAFMQAHGLKDNAALQAYFTARVQTLVTRYGKVTVGWDEVLQPQTPKDVVIQSWRGQDALADAARQGNRGLLSWGYYLDLNEPASQHYAVDPMARSAATLSTAQQALLLGGEAAMWSEYMTPELINARIWPRAAAVAERLWSPQSVTDAASLYSRLDMLAQHLAWYGLPAAPIDAARLQRLLGAADSAALLVLAQVVEPPKEYTREELRPYNSATPLNRLVDVVPAESATARNFTMLAQRVAAGAAAPDDLKQAHRQLVAWRDNDAVLQPLLAQSALAGELAPVSRTLRRTAEVGLAALSAIETATPIDAAARDRELALLQSFEAPQAVLVNPLVPAVALLVRTAAAPPGRRSAALAKP